MRYLHLCLSGSLIIFSASLHAQLLKKMKEKVNTAVDKTLGPNTSSSTGTTQSSSANTGSSTNLIVDFEKHGITTYPIYNAADFREKNWTFDSHNIEYVPVAGGIGTRALVYATNRSMGEDATYIESDAAYTLDNGKVKEKKTVGEVEKAPGYQKLDDPFEWPFTSSANYDPSKELTSDGKKITGYDMVMAVYVNKARTKYYAVVAKFGGEAVDYFFISSDGKKIKLPSLGTALLVNKDFTNAAIYGFTGKLEQEEKKTNNVLQAAGNTLNQSDVYFIDGKVTKNADNLTGGWLDYSGRNILSSEAANGGVFVNGKKVSDKRVMQGDVWCNADASAWCYYCLTAVGGIGQEHLIFSDGTDVPLAVRPRQMIVNGKNYMVWIQTTKGYEGDWILCTKEL